MRLSRLLPSTLALGLLSGAHWFEAARAADSPGPDTQGAAAAPCACNEQAEAEQSKEAAGDPAAFGTDVCIAYMWANHGTWCSYYAWTCPSGPARNVDADCGLPPGVCPKDPGEAGCFTIAMFTMSRASLSAGHPGHDGYTGELLQWKGLKPADKVSIYKMKDKHLRVTYKAEDDTDGDGQIEEGEYKDATVDIEFVFCRVKSTDPPTAGYEEGEFAVAYQIAPPAHQPDEIITLGPESAVDKHCLLLDRGNVVVNAILHESAPDVYLP